MNKQISRQTFLKTGDISHLMFHISRLTLLSLLISFTTTFSLYAQNPNQLQTGDPFETYIRILQADVDHDKNPSLLLRPFNNQQSSFNNLNHPWADQLYFRQADSKNLSFYTPELTRTYNSDMVFGQNDGPLWQGRGYNYLLSLGANYKYGPLEISLRPQYVYIENRDRIDLEPNPPLFPHPFELSEYAMGLSRIDNPQRFGEEPISRLYPGHSYLRLSHSGAAGGISTENMWTGPALYNPLTLSNNAPGFFHAFLGTDGPISTPAGNAEARWFWGGLQESAYFDDDPSNNLRYITGITAAYSPSFVNGLHIGFSRTFVEYYPDDGLGLTTKNLFRVFQPFTKERFALDGKTDSAIHMLSFFGRWIIREYNFEIWAEWGRNDNSFDHRQTFREPVHTRSYVFGFLKRFEVGDNRWLVWDAELTQLENLENTETSYPVWYEHHYVKQGYTHQGQVLGAGIGPGSGSLRLSFTYYEPRGKAGISADRVVRHNDRLFRHFYHLRRNQPRILRDHWGHDIPQYVHDYDIYDTEYRFGGQTVLFLPYNLEIQAELYYSFFLNRHHIYENDVTNLHTLVTFRYMMKGFRR